MNIQPIRLTETDEQVVIHGFGETVRVKLDENHDIIIEYLNDNDAVAIWHPHMGGSKEVS